MPLIKLSNDDLVPLNAFEEKYPILIDLVYAQNDHPDNYFKNLYHPQTKILWAHKDLAKVILVAASMCRELYGWRLRLYDCLRPIEAQEKMAEYGYDPLLVSLPGKGAHPRAMAIDIQPMDIETDAFIEMGTSFDSFSDDPAACNPAARDYTDFDLPSDQVKEILKNRSHLEVTIKKSAMVFGHEILPLPQEWWDFRFVGDNVYKYAPLSEDDLKPYQRLINPDLGGAAKILAGEYPQDMAKMLRAIDQEVQETLLKTDFSGLS